MPPPIRADTLRFGPGTAPEAVACWLMRFFGPQTPASGAPTAPPIVSLSSELPPVRLIADLVVRTGRYLQIIGGDSTLIVGPKQLRVQTGATLGLQQVTIAESVSASALVIAGSVSMTNCTEEDSVVRGRLRGLFSPCSFAATCPLVGYVARSGFSDLIFPCTIQQTCLSRCWSKWGPIPVPAPLALCGEALVQIRRGLRPLRYQTSSARPSSEDWRDLVSLTDLFSTPSLAEIGGLQRALLTEDFFQDVYCAT